MASSDVLTAPATPLPLSQAEWVAHLRQQIEAISCPKKTQESQPEVMSTGIPELDRLLPHGGVPPGCLVEWFATHPGVGAETLSLRMAWHGSAQKSLLVIVDTTRQIYPPGLVYLGIDLKKTVFLHPESLQDAFWAIVQALRCSAVGAVWAKVDRLDMKTARRFLLAAEQGKTLGVLVRPFQAARDISCARVKCLVEPLLCHTESSQRRRVRVTVLRAKGQWEQADCEVWIDDPSDPVSETFGLRLPSGSASPGIVSLRA